MYCFYNGLFLSFSKKIQNYSHIHFKNVVLLKTAEMGLEAIPLNNNKYLFLLLYIHNNVLLNTNCFPWKKYDLFSHKRKMNIGSSSLWLGVIPFSLLSQINPSKLAVTSNRIPKISHLPTHPLQLEGVGTLLISK